MDEEEMWPSAHGCMKTRILFRKSLQQNDLQWYSPEDKILQTILIHYGLWTVIPTPVSEPIGDEKVDWTNSIKVPLLSEDCHEFMDAPWTQQALGSDYFTVVI